MLVEQALVVVSTGCSRVLLIGRRKVERHVGWITHAVWVQDGAGNAEDPGGRLRIRLRLPRLLLACVAVMHAVPGFGHGGGLDARGCHNNRKTGDYHCHRAAPVPQAPRPAMAHPTRGSVVGVVKKSERGICHVPGSTYYVRTLRFTEFETLELCLASGGRTPLR